MPLPNGSNNNYSMHNLVQKSNVKSTFKPFCRRVEHANKLSGEYKARQKSDMLLIDIGMNAETFMCFETKKIKS